MAGGGPGLPRGHRTRCAGLAIAPAVLLETLFWWLVPGHPNQDGGPLAERERVGVCFGAGGKEEREPLFLPQAAAPVETTPRNVWVPAPPPGGSSYQEVF